MRNQPAPEELQLRLSDMLRMEGEPEWIAFQEDPDWETLGSCVCALANAAALWEEPFAHLVYGVNGTDRRVVGIRTDVRKEANRLREVLLRIEPGFAPGIELDVFECESKEGLPVLMVRIPAADRVPAAFDGVEWVRVASALEKLQAFPEAERRLWRSFEKDFDGRPAARGVAPDKVLGSLSDEAYRRTRSLPRLELDELLSRMVQDGLLLREGSGLYAATNLGAIAFARRLSDFPALSRKALRIVRYVGRSRLEAEKAFLWDEGCASDIDGLMRLLKALLPAREVIDEGRRRVVETYPEGVIRELVLNALVHQDYRMAGCGPMLEIFEDRVEITNPGRSLVPASRLIDGAPRRRNEALASLMRHANGCRNGVRGIGRAIAAAEAANLPAIEFVVGNDFFKAVVRARKPFKDYSRIEKLQVCREHCVLKFVSGEPMTRQSLGRRFGLEAKDAAVVGRILRAAVEARLIKPCEAAAGPRLRRYVPDWA